MNESQKPGVFIKTYGCQMNEYDSLKLEKILENTHQKVDSPEKADLVLINTCSVRDKPEQKLYSLLGRMSELKAEKPNLLIGVCGCVAQQEGENIVKRSKAVDLVFGTHNLSLVPSLIERRQSGLPPQVAINYREDWEDLPLGFPEYEKVSAFISISRGCNKNCSYCIVPTTRGKEVSRDANEILREIKIAVHRGVKEIMLLGQTVNSYGLDFNPKIKFTDLLQKVSEIDGLERIRFMSPHPQEIRSDFVDLVTTNPKICHHIHMPLQSGSDRILKMMNRNYRRKRYLEILSELKSKVSDMEFTTDIIVGFPGETEEDFQETLSVMREVKFINCYSYIYSDRPGTSASAMSDQIPYEIKLRRLQDLQALQKDLSQEVLNHWYGKTTKVLIDAKSVFQTNSEVVSWQGRNSQNIVINFESSDLSLKPGSFVEVKIIEVSNYTLRGELLSEPACFNNSIVDDRANLQ